MNEISVGIILILVAAFFQGTYVLFLRFTHFWKWENFWAVFSLIALAILPISSCYVLIPNFGIILSSSPNIAILLSFFCGILWGIGSVLFGLSVVRIGLALTYSLIIGLTAIVGSFLPLFLDSFPSLGVLLPSILGMFVMFLGLTLSAYAGMKREKLQRRKKLKIGLILALISGLTSPMLNLGFVYGNPILQTAQSLGVMIEFASLPIWMIVLLGGFIVNFGYAIYLLIRSKTYKLFPRSIGNHFALSFTSGVFFFSGLTIYGVASSLLETLGASVGWALLMSLMIIISNFSSILMGEWKNCRKALRFQLISISILILGTSIMSLSFYS